MHIKNFACLLVAGLVSLSSAATAAVAPLYNDYYSEDGAAQRRSSDSNWFETIDPYTGQLLINIPLFDIPGNGKVDFSLSWAANSSEPAAGGMHPPRIRTSLVPGTRATLELPDGSTYVFYSSSTAPDISLTINNWKLVGRADSTSGVLYAPNGNRWVMSAWSNASLDYSVAARQAGWHNQSTKPVDGDVQQTAGSFIYRMPASQIDRYGNTVNYTYDGTNLKTMTASDGRSASITWGTGGYPTVVVGNRTWSFNTSGNNHTLTQPDGQTWNITTGTTYNTVMTGGTVGGGNPLVTAVTNPHGGVTSYLYAAYLVFNPAATCPDTQPTCVTAALPWVREQPHPALALKSTSDGSTITYSSFYAAGSNPIQVNAPNAGNAAHISRAVVTTTANKSYTTTYQYISPYEITDCNGKAWSTGLLLQKTIGSVQQETYTWSMQSLPGGQAGMGYCTGNGGRPVLTDTRIVRDGKAYVTHTDFDAYGHPAVITETGDDSKQRITRRSYLNDTTNWQLDSLSTETIGDASSTLSSRTNSYDGSGSLAQSVADGVTTSYAYDSAGNLFTRTDALNLVTRFENYYRGIPRTETRPFASGTEPAWCAAPRSSVAITRVVDDFGNVTSYTDARGKVFSYQYDGMNRLTWTKRPLGNAISISWTPTSRTITRDVYSKTDSFDGYGRSVTTNENGVVVSRRFDPLGRLLFESYPALSVGDTYDYDQLNRVAITTHSDGTSSKFGYTGSAVAVTDENNHVTSSFYQAYGNPDDKALTEVNPDATVSSSATFINRNALGLVTSVQQGSVVRGWQYDSHNFLVGRTDPEIGQTVLGRDAVGNLVSHKVGTQPAGHYAVDAQGRTAASWWDDGVAQQVCTQRDASGHVVSVVNASATRQYTYDDNGNTLTEGLVAAGNTLTLTHVWDADDRLTADIYPNTWRIEYTPDAFGRPTTVGPYASQIAYNGRGSITNWHAPNDRNTHIAYADRGWPASMEVVANFVLPTAPTKPTAPVAPIAPTRPANPTVANPGAQPVAPAQPATAKPGAGITGDTACRKAYRAPILADYDNNAAARLQSDTAIWTAKIAACTTDWNNNGAYWSNGDAGCRQTYTEPKLSDYAGQSNQNARYTDAHTSWQNNMNRCVPTWTSQAQVWVNYYAAVASYNAQLQNWQAANAAYQQDQANYAAAMATYNNQMTDYNSRLATYNQAMTAYQTALNQYNADYAAWQTQVSQIQAGGVAAIQSSYGYDGLGNLTSVTDAANSNFNRQYGYDALNRLTKADGPWGSGTSIKYDANGNLLSQTLGGYNVSYGYDSQQLLRSMAGTKNYSLAYDGWGDVTSRGDGTTYVYDAAGNLRWFNKGASSQIAYSYDGAGSRVLSVATGLNRLEFYDLANKLIYEKDLSSGAVHVSFFLNGQRIADDNAGVANWYHNDVVGSPLAATDGAGHIAWNTYYRPYGERMLGASSTNKQWFGGKSYEDASGLSYFGARWYDPVIGRFMAMDPVDWDEDNLIHSFNAFAYTSNNPVSRVDVSGASDGTPAEAAADQAGKLNQGRGASIAKILSNPNLKNRAVQEEIKNGTMSVEEMSKNAFSPEVADAVESVTVTAPKPIPKAPTGRGSVDPSKRDPQRIYSRVTVEKQLDKQNQKCGRCQNPLKLEDAKGHHIERHADGGKTDEANLAVVCAACHFELHRRN